MVNPFRVLILTSKTGSGHLSLAEALRERLAQDFAVKIADDLLPPSVHRHYTFAGRHALWLWSAEFRLTNARVSAWLAHQTLIPLIARRMSAVMSRFQPNVVITTHPLLSHSVKCVLAKHAPYIPFVMLFSDPGRVHATWLTCRTASATLAPTDETYQQAVDAGFPRDHLFRIPWPVRNQFARTNEPTRDSILDRLNQQQGWNLDPNRFTIFLQGGGDGAAKLGSTLEQILAINQDLQVILATGTNTHLLTRYNGIRNLYLLPFSSDIAPFMSAAHVVAGKAGPNSLFESIALNKPFIATSYMPGQEKANLDFITRHGLGWIGQGKVPLHKLIRDLVADYSNARVLLSSTLEKVNSYRQMAYRQQGPPVSDIGTVIRALIVSRSQ